MNSLTPFSTVLFVSEFSTLRSGRRSILLTNSEWFPMYSVVETWQESSRHQLWILFTRFSDNFITPDMRRCNPRCFFSMLSFSISLMFNFFKWFTNRLFRLLAVVLSVLSVGVEIIISQVGSFCKIKFFSPNIWSTIFSGVQNGALFVPISKTMRSGFLFIITLRVIRKWRSLFFSVKNLKSRKAVMEFSCSFKSFRSSKKVTESFSVVTLH